MDPTREKEQRQTQDNLETQCGDRVKGDTWGEAEKIAKNREEWKDIVFKRHYVPPPGTKRIK